MAKADCPEEITYFSVSEILKVRMLGGDDFFEVTVSELF